MGNVKHRSIMVSLGNAAQSHCYVHAIDAVVHIFCLFVEFRPPVCTWKLVQLSLART